MHDRYACYDSIKEISHQLCRAHLLRDLEDAAQTYPDAIWPGQIADELRALIHAAKHGHHIFTAIRDALAGNPWIPPVPVAA